MQCTYNDTYNVNKIVDDYDANKEGIKEVEIAEPLKYLSNFCRTLDIPLINCKVSLTLSWSANFVITSLEKRLVTAPQGDNTAVHNNFPTNNSFKIIDTKLYVPVATLLAENDKKTFRAIKNSIKKNYFIE